MQTKTVKSSVSETVSFEQAVALLGVNNMNDVAASFLVSELSANGTVSNVVYTGVGGAAYLVGNLGLGAVGNFSGGILLSTGDFPPTSNTQSSYGRSNSAPGDGDLTTTVKAAFSGAGTTNDAAIIEFTVNVTQADIDGIKFDVIFGSDEFPEYSDTTFVDIAAIYVNDKNYALFDSDALKPLSILDGNLPYFNDNTGSAFPIEWDGFSSKLSIRAPVKLGLNTIKIAIADTGDYIYDSGLYINNIELTAGGGTIGEPVKAVDGTSGNDVLEASLLKEGFVLAGGSDSISGTLEDLNGDIVEGFGEDDTLIFQSVVLGPQNLQVLQGSAILNIDSNLDGIVDSTVTLSGNFSGAAFAFQQLGGNSHLTVDLASSPGIINSLSFEKQLEVIYFGYFDRAADGEGFSFWLDQNVKAQASGQSAEVALTNIANSFRPQPETVALYPALGIDNPDFSSTEFQQQLSDFLDDVYQNLFNRAPDAEGKSYWTGQILSGEVGLGAAILAIANGAIGDDVAIVLNKAEASLYFTNETDDANLPVNSDFLAQARAVLAGVDGSAASVAASKAQTDLYIDTQPSFAIEYHAELAVWADDDPDGDLVELVGVADTSETAVDATW